MPWKADVLPPMNAARYAARAARAAKDRDYAVGEARPGEAAARSLADAASAAPGLSKSKTRKAIQAGKARVRGADGVERQVFDPDYVLKSNETWRLDG